jgi:tetratricopeptide (TPR) repeat protein
MMAEENFNTGLQQLNSNRSAEARRSFERSISLNPTYEAYANLGLLCDHAQDKKCTLDSYNNAIKLNPKDYAAYYNLGSYYEDQGDFGSAIAAYRKSIEVSRGQAPEPLNNLARLLILQGNYTDAKALIDKGLLSTQDKQARSTLFKNLGWIYLGQRKYAEANGRLRESIALKSDLTSSHCLLAQALEAQKQTAKAEWKLCLSIQGEDASSPEVSHWRSIPIDRMTNEI